MRFTAKLSMHAGKKAMTYVRGIVEGNVSIDGAQVGVIHIPYRILGIKRDNGTESLRAFATGWGDYNNGKSTIAPYSDDDLPKVVGNAIPVDEVFLAVDAAGEGVEVTLEIANGAVTEISRRNVARGAGSEVNPSVQAKLLALSERFMAKSAATQTLGVATVKTADEVKDEARAKKLAARA